MRPNDLKKMIRIAIDQNINLMITGAPGIGKTKIVSSVAEQIKAEAQPDKPVDIMITHPVVEEVTEYSGFAFPAEDRQSAKLLPYGNLLKMIKHPRTGLLIIIIDDIGQAPVPNQCAIMQLVEQREINGVKISPACRFIMLTNRREDKAGVSIIISTLKGRSAIYALDVNADDWRTWANQNGMPSSLVAFSKLRPNMLFDLEKPSSDIVNTYNPRNIERAGRFQLAGIPEHLEFETFTACCGEKWASEYSAYLKIARNTDDPQTWIDNPNKPLPDNDSIMYAVLSAISAMATPKNVKNIFKLAMIIDAEYSTYLVFSMLQRDKRLGRDSAMGDWSRKYASFLA